MSTSNFYLFVFILLFSSCQTDQDQGLGMQKSAAPNEVSVKDTSIGSLNSIADKKDFLEKLFAADQNLRIQTSDIIKKYGPNSTEHRDIVKRTNRADAVNLAKVRAYFKEFGYPHPAEMGEQAARAPVYVIHRAPNNTPRKEFLPILFKAYQDKKLDSAFFEFFLGRMYDVEFGKRMERKSGSKEVDRIDAYLAALEFEAE